MNYLLDTNAWSAVLKETSPPLSEQLHATDPSRIMMSAVVWFELQWGLAYAPPAKRDKLLARVAALMEDVPVTPFGDEAATAAARVHASLRRAGTPIGAYDVLIAGHAIALGATLVTNNTSEFERVPGLRLADWTRPA